MPENNTNQPADTLHLEWLPRLGEPEARHVVSLVDCKTADGGMPLLRKR